MKRKRKSQLVFQHLENMPGEALEDYQELIRCYVHHKSGIYALYRNNKLYYVGLATNLNGRLKSHLIDRHAGLWDRFSVYLTEGDKHLREIEALVLRIALPTGNRQKGKLKRSENLKKKFGRDINNYHKQIYQDMFENEVKAKQIIKKTGKRDRQSRKVSEPVLNKYTRKWLWLKMTYKGQVYRAHKRKDGTIKFDQRSHRYRELKNKVFFSPSAAGYAVSGKANDGWMWWHFMRNGKWIRLDELRGRLHGKRKVRCQT